MLTVRILYPPIECHVQVSHTFLVKHFDLHPPKDRERRTGMSRGQLDTERERVVGWDDIMHLKKERRNSFDLHPPNDRQTDFDGDVPRAP
ncbi:hypothetical protein JTE90_002970 [Oedothorax gibbosus]|uniref:Uncharacterized protein n=1 Tax=Oedothorax gibbosus TaxID=931172 RepID=A0AAV6VIG7_9ARAC|nr:hypothetical protein JTE90_002970 [Oedothorax gibbosus]